MEHSSFEWKDEYNIGVEVVDTAHRRLFTVVNRIIDNFMNRDFDKNKTVCIEAIKYLKSYALQHFSEEEAYMLSINYPGYKTHRKIHDNMRDVVIPALEQEVMSKSYSKESLEHFVGTCAGWLAAHILIEDQAITGKTHSKWNSGIDESREDALDRIVKGYIQSLFKMSAITINRNYAGYHLGKVFCYCDTYLGSDGKSHSATLAIEETVLENIAKRFVKDEEALKISEVILPMLCEMIKSLNMEILAPLLGLSLKSVESKQIAEDAFYRNYETKYPDFSMIWRTNYGYIAFCAI